MIRFYDKPRIGIFNGFINTPKMDTVESVVESKIIGESLHNYVTEVRTVVTPMWDEMGRYHTECCIDIGFHKSRLIKWKHSQQLKLFDNLKIVQCPSKQLYSKT